VTRLDEGPKAVPTRFGGLQAASAMPAAVPPGPHGRHLLNARAEEIEAVICRVWPGGRDADRIWQDAAALLESAHARYQVGEVAVPYGRCTEPSNVQAGGGACPIRFRCAGCDHFRTDVSYLPDLTAYLDDLLRTRERLAAVINGVDEWARADATPAEEEITRIRRLIGRVKADMTGLSDPERARVDEAVTVIRKHRAVSLGMPSVRTPPPSPASEALA
jgi:hypothetical protein